MNSTFKTIKVDTSSKYVFSVILNRPAKKNALNNLLISELTQVFNDLNKNNNCRVIILSSSSEVFCSGADLDSLKIMQNQDENDNLEDSKKLMELFKSILYSSKLTIAKVDGVAIAGGCGLATACDIIFASEKAKFGYSEVRIGFVPALVSVFISQRINYSNAKELFLTGKLINAEKAKNINLINYLVNSDQLESEINNFCMKFIQNSSPESVKITKELLLNFMELENKFEIAKDINSKSRKNKDCIIGINAFLNKEKINWASKN